MAHLHQILSPSYDTGLEQGNSDQLGNFLGPTRDSNVTKYIKEKNGGYSRSSLLVKIRPDILRKPRIKWNRNYDPGSNPIIATDKTQEEEETPTVENTTPEKEATKGNNHTKNQCEPTHIDLTTRGQDDPSDGSSSDDED